MAFQIYSAGGETQEDRPQVDWAALNAAVVAAADMEQPTTIVGVISGIHDLGIQPQDDAQLLWTGTEEEKAAELAKSSSTYFEDLPDYNDGGKVKTFKRFPSKPAQSVALTIDFPDVIVDKGIFFGESNPAPLRLVIGGEFKGFVQKPIPLTVRNNEKTGNKWSFPFNHTLYKMAVAAKIVKQGEPFVRENIDQLLGKALQFKAQVFFNKDGFYTEKCAFAASLSRGQAVPVLDEKLLGMVMFNAENTAEDLGQLRNSIKKTMRRASNFKGSKLATQIGEGFVRGQPAANNDAEEEKEINNVPVAKVAKPSKAKVIIEETEPFPDFEDEDIPFN